MKPEEILILTLRGAQAKFGKNTRKELSKLIRIWHPDVCKDPRARDVIERLTRLRAQDTGGDSAPRPALRAFTSLDGHAFGLRPVSTFRDPVTEVLVCDRSVSRIFPADDTDLAQAAIETISEFRFADTEMRDEMMKGLPEVPKVTRLSDGSVMHTFRRRRDQLPLRDLISARGPLDVRASAWIISGLLNICCWLSWAQRSHAGISPEMILVSPEIHEVSLFGGWEFSAPMQNRPLALPDKTLRFFPSLSDPKSGVDEKVDLALVREVLMQMSGVTHTSGMLGGGLPAPIARWAAFPAIGRASSDYAAWKTALKEAFGPPKFVDMGVAPEDIYQGSAT